jgi:hypothetical protein
MNWPCSAPGQGQNYIQDFGQISEERNSSGAVGTATGYRLDNRGVGVRVRVGSTIFTSLYPPDQLWGPSSLLSNGYQGLFPPKVEAYFVKHFYNFSVCN